MSSKTNIVLLPLEGDLDVRSVPQVKATVSRLIEDGCRRVVMSMARVEYVDSAGVGLLLYLVHRMRRAGGLLSLTDVSPRLMRMFKRYRLVDYVPVSCVGQRQVVPELDSSTRPLSCNVLRVDANNLSGARGRVTELLRPMDFSDDALFDMTLAVGEALGNAIDHTSCEGVLATVTTYADRAVVEVSDCGCGYELKAGDEPVTTCDPVERGRGIKLMRLLADSVTIGLKPSGRGTVVRLVKMVHPVITADASGAQDVAGSQDASSHGVADSQVATAPQGATSHDVVGSQDVVVSGASMSKR